MLEAHVPIAQAHSARLTERIRTEIAACNGWISFEHYMAMALYEPGLGYYSAGTHKLGQGGDFVTAPQISPLFSHCLAGQCAEVLATLSDKTLFELGAGTGVMAADILTALAALDALPSRYFILEVSADLRARQQATLAARVPQWQDRVMWLDAVPAEFTGVLLANEVLDAQPVQRFRCVAGQVQALGITWEQDHFVWAARAASAPLQAAVRHIEQSLGRPLPDGYTSEINLHLTAFIKTFATALKQGVMLWIDYGLPRAEYYSVERQQGTVLCHYQQQVVLDPLLRVGLQDIGAWVDFTAVAEAAMGSGLDVMGFATQAHFLMGAGIDRYAQASAQADIATRARLSQQIQRLILPGEMGECFKVLGLAKCWRGNLSGFSFRDLRDRL